MCHPVKAFNLQNGEPAFNTLVNASRLRLRTGKMAWLTLHLWWYYTLPWCQSLFRHQHFSGVSTFLVPEPFLAYQHTIQDAHQPPRKEPTNTAKLRIDLVHLSSDPKYSNAPPHLCACAQRAFHTRFTRQTNSTPPPSVRTHNLRTQEYSHHKGSLRSTSRISSQLTSMRVCALGLGSKWGGPKAAVGQGS